MADFERRIGKFLFAINDFRRIVAFGAAAAKWRAASAKAGTVLARNDAQP
ncbi:MAG: hypothetical protein JOZ96_07070 [Acidobacteria bacterium]|nr:hypothetical protein [Acidobacteriota bacterium]